MTSEMSHFDIQPSSRATRSCAVLGQSITSCRIDIETLHTLEAMLRSAPFLNPNLSATPWSDLILDNSQTVASIFFETETVLSTGKCAGKCGATYKQRYSRVSMAQTLMAHSPELARNITMVTTGHFWHN